MTGPTRSVGTRWQSLAGAVVRELSGIAGIDAAIPHAPPDYVVMLHDMKMAKQANVEQMATLVRMQGGAPDEHAGIRGALTRMAESATSRISLTLTLQAMRLRELELSALYAEIRDSSDRLSQRAFKTIGGRAQVHAHLLTAHLAKRNGDEELVAMLSAPLGDYFADEEARACMRCHLDRPAVTDALVRSDPHPYTYICRACHADVLAAFDPDLSVQMERWPRAVREAKVMQHAMGRVSKLNATRQVLHPLAGLDSELPTPAASRHFSTSGDAAPTPGPARGEHDGTLVVTSGDGLEGAYVQELFSPTLIWQRW